jgi:hypothetical protein
MSEAQKKKAAELLKAFLDAPVGPEKEAARKDVLAFIDELGKSADEGYAAANTVFDKYIPGYKSGRRRKTRGRKTRRRKTLR